MKIMRTVCASSVVAVAAIALTAYSSFNHSDSSSSDSGVDNGGSATPAVSAVIATTNNCFSSSLSAAGSTAQQNVMQQAISGYQNKCNGAKISYNGTGSGAGITSFLAKQIDFAGSDSALRPSKGETDKAKTACGSEALDIPMIAKPIAISYNLQNVDKLNLTPTLIARIFSGKIIKWNDSTIAAENKGVALPSIAISVFFRSDSSGTTDNFSNYMNTTDPTDWPNSHAKSWTGKVGQGKAKTAGVASAVKSTEGGIGYVEWDYVAQNKLSMATLNDVVLTAESADKAVAAATVTGTGNDLTLKLDYKTSAAGAYPIILMSYEIACSKYSDTTKGKSVKAFLSYMASPALQNSLSSVGAAPLPSDIQNKVVDTINTIS